MSSAELNPVSLIAKKRDGGELNGEEIQFFVSSIVDKSMQDSQIGALLMAIYLNQLNDSEAYHLVNAMMHSGDVLTWPEHERHLVVDKHSSGGVGDKISIPLAPLLAAVGMKVPMISGQSLGHTGGTLDKLKSIPGYNPFIGVPQIQNIVTKVGCAIVGQSETLVVADMILYKTRDITSTVKCNGLILGSILSKKLAEGCSTILIDLKCGSAAIYKTPEDAQQMAHQFIGLTRRFGVKCVCVISRMEEPLGNTIGNTLEVVESLEWLKGNSTSHSLTSLIMELAIQLMVVSGLSTSREEAEVKLSEVWRSGKALQKFSEMMQELGVSEADATKLCSSDTDCYSSVLPRAESSVDVTSEAEGMVVAIDGLALGILSNYALGAGRVKSTDEIDPSAGIELIVHLGSQVKKGDTIARVHAKDEIISEEIVQRVRKAFSLDKTDVPFEQPRYIYDVIQ